jgi:hypothetical protein
MPIARRRPDRGPVDRALRWSIPCNGHLQPATVVYINKTTRQQTISGDPMRHIMVMNAKGGCGKSTIATNIASYFADEGYSVALADYDPQRSSLDWLERRPDTRPAIAGVAAFQTRGLSQIDLETCLAPLRTSSNSENKYVLIITIL